MNLRLLFLCLLSLFTACRPQPSTRTRPERDLPEAPNKFSDATLRQLYTLQDARKSAELQQYFTHLDPRYRAAAALAFGSVQDTAAIGALAALLQDKEAPVRQAAAYALGQTGRPAAEAALLTAIAAESSYPVRSQLLEAWGQCGTLTNLPAVLNLRLEDSLSRAGLGWALYRAGQRGVFSEAGTAKALSLADLKNPRTVRLPATHYLARTPKLDLTSAVAPLLQLVAADSLTATRLSLIGALGKVNEQAVWEALVQVALTAPDYRVKTAAIRALSKAPYITVREAVWTALDDANPNLSLTAAEYLLQHALEGQPGRFVSKAFQIRNWRTRAVLLQAAIRYAPNKTEAGQQVLNLYLRSENPYEKGLLLKALAEDFSWFNFIRKETFAAKNVVVSTYGMEALAEMRKAPGFRVKLKKPFNQLLVQAIESGDVALIGTAAVLLRDPALDLKKSFSKIGFMEAAQAKLVLPRDFEAWNELQQTLRYFKTSEPGKAPAGSAPAPAAPAAADISRHAINWALIEKLPRNQRVRVFTPKGKITIELLVEDAPGSVAMFVEQVRSGFYNGRTFHRIVPNFVAQGGCPRGDGWGSLDYTIRSEFHPGRYSEGALGLASAGKDTESCQWFFTHQPTPHLEGRYTLFAKVVDGMDVVHQLELGDIMTKVEEVY